MFSEAERVVMLQRRYGAAIARYERAEAALRQVQRRRFPMNKAGWGLLSESWKAVRTPALVVMLLVAAVNVASARTWAQFLCDVFEYHCPPLPYRNAPAADPLPAPPDSSAWQVQRPAMLQTMQHMIAR